MTKIQEILEYGLEEYKKENKIPKHKIKVMEALRDCKTEKLGGHTYTFDNCGHEKQAYNSCRNRHCPSCQAGKKAEWIDERKKEVLNIKYYHIVNTIAK